MNKLVFGIFCAGLLFVFGCGKQGRMGCNYDACSLIAPDAEVQQVQAYLTTNNINAVKHCSGMYYQIVAEGSGTAPTPCSTITINYVGYLTNGNIFDKSTAPVSFSLIDLIQGWKKGLPLIKKGGKIKLIIPPSLGYGSTARQGLPANSILVFDIELLATS